MFGKIGKVWNGLTYSPINKFDNEIKTVRFVNKSTNKDPEYAHEDDSGFDLRAWITDNDEGVRLDPKTNENFITLKSLERRLIHTGLYVELPENTEAQVRTRSGLALKEGLVVANSPGTVDNLYRNEVGVIVLNTSKKSVTISNGDRIAQMVICPVYLKGLINLQKIDEVNVETERGLNGFGSSGVK